MFVDYDTLTGSDLDTQILDFGSFLLRDMELEHLIRYSLLCQCCATLNFVFAFWGYDYVVHIVNVATR
jgi:hypothetical protein